MTSESRPLRVLQVDKFHRRFGGAAGYMFDVAELLRSQGHTVEFFGAAHPDNLDAIYGHLFPDVAGYDPPPEGAWSKVTAGASMFWSVRAERAMAAVVDDFRPDIVHLHNIYHQLSPSILRPLRARGIPAVMTVHDFKLMCPTYRFHDGTASCEACLGGGFHNAVRRRCKSGSVVQSALVATETTAHRWFRAYGSIRRLICPSRFLRDKLAEAGFDERRLVHLPNFTQVPISDAVPNPAGSRVFHFGRMSQEKGVDTLIAACAAPAPLELRIAGDGPLLADLRAQSERLGGDTTFLGHVGRDVVLDELERASVAVFPARGYENMPLAIIEAMARGVPVIVTDIGGSPELLDTGAGFTVPPDDPAALRTAIERCFDPDVRRRCGQAGIDRVRDDYSPEVHLGRIEALYRDVLQHDAAARRAHVTARR